MGDGLFREEALRHHTGGRAQGDLLRIAPAWTRWAFAFLIFSGLFAAAFSYFGTVPTYARGVARVSSSALSETAATVLFPEAARFQLRPGMPLRLSDRSDPGRSIAASVAAIDPDPWPLSDALDRLRIPAWPSAHVPSVVVVVRVRLEGYEQAATVADGEILDAQAEVGSRSVLSALLPAPEGKRRDE